MNDLSVVILAAGLGTRMKSRKAKVLHEAGGLPLIEHVVRSACTLTAPERIVVVVGHQAERVQAVLAGRGFHFALQAEQKGTGHAVASCAPLLAGLAGRVVILYGDGPLLSGPTLHRLVQHHLSARASATVITTELENPTGYGRVLLDQEGFIREIVEEKAATSQQKEVRLINSGISCFEGELLWNQLEALEPNPASGEYYLTDVFEMLNKSGHRVASLLHEDSHELLGINTRVELAMVDEVFRRRKARELMLAGVTIERPESAHIDVDVRVGIDTVVEPAVQLLGRTVIGEDCRIGVGSVIRDSTLHAEVSIAPYTIVNTSVIESGASVGPFARLRMENHVGAGSHIGNFVELKKTRFGPGVKAGHLAYLGDAEIGADTNVGAGTITCNFDGAKKHKTTVGQAAFLGSNSTLVAPVDIGPHAYIAAGSVITEPVAEDALGLGRARQVNKEGWARKRRAQAKASSSGPGDAR